MALDYMIDQPCKVKEALSVDGLVSLIKQRDRGLAVIDMMMKGGKSEEEAFNSTIKIQVQTPGGAQVKEMKVSDMLRGALRLNELQAHCNGCPASSGRAFGCYKSIGYPISGKAEAWLAGISKNAAESKGIGMLPLQFILEQKMGGGPFTTMRADPNGMFFELKRPLEIAVSNGSVNKGVVNTDQVFNLLAGMERMRGPHMKMLLFFSGGLAIVDAEPQAGSYPQMFKAMDGNGKTSWWTYSLKGEAGDDASTQMLKEYFRSLFVAYALGRDVLVSP